MLLLVNFVSGFRLELLYISLIENIRPSLIHFHGFRSSRSTPDLLTVVSDRIAKAFNRSGATQAVALYIIQGFWQGLVCLSSSQNYVL